MFESHDIELHLAQLLPIIKIAYRNKYHTSRIKKYLKEITSVIDYIRSQELSAKSEGQREIYQQILTYFSSCLDYVLNSTTKGVSSETYYGLRIALEDWITDSDKYIFVACDGAHAIWMIEDYTTKIYDSIKKECGIDLYYRVIPFYVPRHLRYDYLSNVALYHELGHFIDSKLKVTDTIFTNTIILRKNPIDLSFYYILAPTTPDGNFSVSHHQFRSHTSEYFADVFGSQYVGEQIYQNLNYVAPKADFSDTHPKTELRVKLVDDFLADPVNLKGLLNSINDICTLSIRNKPICVDSFLKGKPVCPSDKKQIHSLLSETWRLWNKRRDEFVDHNGVPLPYIDIYSRTKRLIERSVKKYRDSTSTTTL